MNSTNNLVILKNNIVTFIAVAVLLIASFAITIIRGESASAAANDCIGSTQVPYNTGRGWNSTYSGNVIYKPGTFCLIAGQFKAIFQTDGNLVVYKGNVAKWSSGTAGKVGSNGFLSLQLDGNVVIYNGQNKPLWFTATSVSGPNSRVLQMQSDGNFVLYREGGTTAPYAIWATNTAGV